MESWETQYRWGGMGNVYGSRKYLAILHFITPLAQSNQSIGYNLSSKGSNKIAFPLSKWKWMQVKRVQVQIFQWTLSIQTLSSDSNTKPIDFLPPQETLSSKIFDSHWFVDG